MQEPQHKKQVGIWIWCVLLGLGSGALGTLVHGAYWIGELNFLGVPGLTVGVVLAWMLSGSAIFVAGLLYPGVNGAALALVGWFLSLVMFTTVRPAGDIILTGLPYTNFWIYGGVILGVMLLFVPFKRVESKISGNTR